MTNCFAQRVASVLWHMLILMVVLLATYVSIGRYLMSGVSQWQEGLLAEINSRVPFVLRAESVHGHWQSFSPQISFSDLRIESFSENLPPVELAGGRVTLDLWASLLDRSLQFSSLALDGLTVRAVLTEQGTLEFPGLPKGEGGLRDWLWEFLNNVEQVQLEDNTLKLALPQGKQRTFDLQLTLQREFNDWRLRSELQSPEGHITVDSVASGKGIFGTPDSFSGDFYTRVNSADLSTSLDLFPPQWLSHLGALEGEAQVQAWFSWRRGQAELALQVDGQKLEVSGTGESGWRLPADALSFSMEVGHHDSRWQGVFSELQVTRGDNTLQIPRFELSGLGQQLQVRAEQIELAPLVDLVSELGVLSPDRVDILGQLALKGNLSSMFYRVEDLQQPGLDWAFEANFENLGLSSFRGAPGSENAAGYLSLNQEGGRVKLDSTDVSLALPKVYRDVREYTSVVGALDIEFQPGGVALSSNVIEARDGDQDARLVFGMNIPLPMQESKVGVEMDLLIGALDLPASLRDRYIPYKLNEELRSWLSTAVLDGQVKEGGFLWRGSLRKKSAPLRTVQLYLEARGADLRYDQRWPDLTDLDGLVMVDDALVSVWADRAQLLDSEVTHLSAETFRARDGKLLLDIEASVEGSATDGLTVINESPLNQRVNGTFAEWQVEGVLATELALRLGLADPDRPLDIDLKTNLGLELVDISPAGLLVNDFSGQLYYQLHGGFSSKGLAGTLWGEPLTVEVSEQAGPALDGDALQSSLQIDLASAVDAEDLRGWMQADILHFIDGRTEVNGRLTVEQGQPILNLASDLQGIVADLPEPFAKRSGDSRPLQLRIPLGVEEAICDLDLGADLAAKIALKNYKPSAISLGLGTPALATNGGRLRVTGSVFTLDLAQWQGFLDRYIALGENRATDHTENALALQIEDLLVDEVLTEGREIHRVILDIRQQPDQWQVALETDWVKGQAQLTPDFDSIVADVDFLDISGLRELKLGEIDNSESPIIDIPDLAIAIRELARDGLVLGHVDFRAMATPEGIAVRDIHGNYAGLQVDPQTPARLDWLSREGGPRSRFEGDVTFTDLGKVLSTLGFEEVVQSREGQFSLNLDWPGTPMHPRLAGAAGEFSMSLGEGQFLNTPAGATGTLQVVGILNLAQFVRMLSLDSGGNFNDGVPFYGVEGEVVLMDNLMRVTEAEVDARNGRFGFTGSVDVISEEMDAELAVTLPVANNIPWIAALLGGLPAAAGAFIVSKLFENQMDRFASAVYRVQGPWYKPSTTFTRIFDNETRKDLTPEDLELAAEDVSADAGPPASMEAGEQQPISSAEEIDR